MIGWEYPPHNSGGLGVACQGLTQALALRSHQLYFTLPYDLAHLPPHMRVMTCRDPKWSEQSDLPPFGAYSADLVSSQIDPKHKKLYAHDLAALPSSQIEKQVGEYADLVAKQASATNYDFDVIHAHDWMSFPAAIKVQQESGKPMIAHVHSTEYDRIPSGHGSAFITQTERQGMMKADLVIAVSHYTKRLLIKHYQIPSKKIQVVHNGMDFSEKIDPGRHHFAPARPTVVFMGRLTSQKGPGYFVSLAHQVLSRVPDALFIAAGHGDMYQSLLLKTAGEGLSAKVLFSGFVRGRQRDTLLDRADVFVMPSLSEPFGLVALEAAERHTPVIVSKNAGVSEVLPSAISLDFWDLNKMTKTIVKLLVDQGYHQSVVSEQKKQLEGLTWSKVAGRMEKVYQSLFSRRRPS